MWVVGNFSFLFFFERLSSEEGSHARGRCHAVRRYGLCGWAGEVEMGFCPGGRVSERQPKYRYRGRPVFNSHQSDPVYNYVRDRYMPLCGVGARSGPVGAAVGWEWYL